MPRKNVNATMRDGRLRPGYVALIRQTDKEKRRARLATREADKRSRQS